MGYLPSSQTELSLLALQQQAVAAQRISQIEWSQRWNQLFMDYKDMSAPTWKSLPEGRWPMGLRKLYRDLRDSIYVLRDRMTLVEEKLRRAPKSIVCFECGVLHVEHTTHRVRKRIIGFGIQEATYTYCKWCAPEYNLIEDTVKLGTGVPSIKYYKTVAATKVEVDGP